ncbi:MAG: HU family DNA-binding protein [Lentisphaerae bacterium]|nr:HU family DNA-binding protein [Lentisphaerota bacterium]
MTRRDLAQELQNRVGRSRAAGEMLEYVQTMIDCLADALAEGRHIEFRDFGVFSTVERKARIGRNPRRPGDLFAIPARRVIKFKPARKLLARIEDGQAKGKTR